MRRRSIVALIALVACGPSPVATPVTAKPSAIDSGLSSLRQTAAAAAISLEVADASTPPMINSRGCTDTDGGSAVVQAGGVGCIRCVLATGESPDRGMRVLATELGRYPVSLLRAAGLKKLALCSLLTTDGGTGRDEEIGGTVDADEGRLLMTVKGGLSMSVPPRETFAVYAFHHEFYHLFDYATSLWAEDPEWERLNPAGFRYVDSGSDGPQAEDPPGFITDYAKKNLAEDKAEVFAHLVLKPQSFCIEHDPNLRAKGRLVRARIEHASAPKDLQRLLDVPCLPRRPTLAPSNIRR